MTHSHELQAVVSALEESDVVLFVDDGVLHFDAPQGAYTDDLRARVALHRTELVAMLSANAATPATPDDPLERFEERAAILEFDAGFTRAEAEAMAWAEVSR